MALQNEYKLKTSVEINEKLFKVFSTVFVPIGEILLPVWSPGQQLDEISLSGTQMGKKQTKIPSPHYPKPKNITFWMDLGFFFFFGINTIFSYVRTWTFFLFYFLPFFNLFLFFSLCM